MIKEIFQIPLQYEEYWVLRAVNDTRDKKVVVSEREFGVPPTEQEIFDYLNLTKCSFVSVEHNYRLVL